MTPPGRRAAAAALVLLAGAPLALAQSPARTDPLPFSVGEEAVYQVRLGGVSVGRGSLAVTEMTNVRGASTFHAVMTIAGGNPLVRVNNRLETWIDARGLFSRRYHENKHEARYRRNRTYDFFPESRTYRRENGETGSIPTSRPLDDLSFLYFARTLPLEPGATYTVPRYFKEDGNPVVIQVLRRESVTVPAGRYDVIVVRPIIRTDGLFGEGGRAEVYLSDDAYRIPVLIRSRVPLIGSLSMHLRTFRPGR
jgi:hypothetical protein